MLETKISRTKFKEQSQRTISRNVLHAHAGESQEGIKPRMAELWRSGIGGILDYAAEDDVSEEGGPASRGEEHSTVVARTFDYADEAKCDSHMHIFLQSIAAAEQSEGQGFAAIKVLLPDH